MDPFNVAVFYWLIVILNDSHLSNTPSEFTALYDVSSTERIYLFVTNESVAPGKQIYSCLKDVSPP